MTGRFILFSSAEEERAALRGLALVFVPAFALIAMLIWAIAPAKPDVSVVYGCYGRGGLPIVRVAPTGLWVGDGLISTRVSVVRAKPDYQVHTDKGFTITPSGRGYVVSPAFPKGMIFGVYLDSKDRPLLRLPYLGEPQPEPGTTWTALDETTVPKVRCPPA